MRCRLMVLSSCADPLKSITILWLRRWHGPLRCEHQIIKILIYSLHSEVVLSRTPSKTPKMRHIFALIVVVYASSTAFGQNSRPRPSTIYQIMGPPRRSVGYPFKANDIRVHLPLRSKLTCMISPHCFYRLKFSCLTFQDQNLEFGLALLGGVSHWERMMRRRLGEEVGGLTEEVHTE